MDPVSPRTTYGTYGDSLYWTTTYPGYEINLSDTMKSSSSSAFPRGSNDLLCATCLQIPFQQWFNLLQKHEDGLWATPSWDLQALRGISRNIDGIVSERSCPFCRLLASVIEWSEGAREIEDGMVSMGGYRSRMVDSGEEECGWAPAMRGVTIRASRKSRGGNPLVRLPWDILPISPPLTAGGYDVLKGGRVQEDVVEEVGEGPHEKAYPRHARLMDERTVDLSLVRRWIERCDRTHQGSCRQGSGQGWRRPFLLRLIDVESGRVITTELGREYEYLALSYVWGNTSKQQILDYSTQHLWSKIRALFARAPRRSLPNIINDATVLTRLLGYRYLWVDALCIPQDSPGEKATQIENMDQIYRFAFFTIVAAAGDDSDAGLPGLPSRPRENTHQASVDVGGLQLATASSSEYEELEESKWNSRAWTFQEKLCSRRTLIFTKSLVVFWCGKTVYREDVCMEGVDQEPHQLFDNLNPISDLMLRENRVQNVSKLFDSRFTFILMHYLRRTLSRADDILNAFAGIAGSMRFHFGGFYHGLPVRCFQRALSWTHRNFFQRRESFPSWSWAGWYHATHFTNSDIYSHGQDFRPTLTVHRFVRSEHWARTIPEDASNGDGKRHPHFESDSATIEASFRSFPTDSHGIDTFQLIAFFTSSSKLLISTEPYKNDEPPWWKGDREVMAKYAIQRPDAGQVIGAIVLDKVWVSLNVTSDSLHDFIVICPHISTDGTWDDPDFLLMLIEWNDSIAYRIQVSNLVSGAEWWRCETKRRLIVLG
jgi:Heterokaryon incompatibility protein (HET)